MVLKRLSEKSDTKSRQIIAAVLDSIVRRSSSAKRLKAYDGQVALPNFPYCKPIIPYPTPAQEPPFECFGEQLDLRQRKANCFARTRSN